MPDSTLSLVNPISFISVVDGKVTVAATSPSITSLTSAQGSENSQDTAQGSSPSIISLGSAPYGRDAMVTHRRAVYEVFITVITTWTERCGSTLGKLRTSVDIPTFFGVDSHECPKGRLCKVRAKAFEEHKRASEEIFKTSCPPDGQMSFRALFDATWHKDNMSIVKRDIHEGRYQFLLVYMHIDENGEFSYDAEFAYVTIKAHHCKKLDTCHIMEQACQRECQSAQHWIRKGNPKLQHVSAVALWTLACRVPSEA